MPACSNNSSKNMQNLTARSGIGEELLRQIVDLLGKFGVERAVLFGSRARGDFRDTSDIDIAFWGEINEPELWLAIESLPTIHKVDLVNFDTLTNDDFKQNILRDAVEIV